MLQRRFQAARAGGAREALIADEGRVADHRVIGRRRLVFEKVTHGDGSVEARLAKAGFSVPGRRFENLHAVKPLAPAARRRSDAFQPFGRREKEARLAARRLEDRVAGGADGPFDEGVCDTRRCEEGASRFVERVRSHSGPPGGSCRSDRPQTAMRCFAAGPGAPPKDKLRTTAAARKRRKRRFPRGGAPAVSSGCGDVVAA